MSGEDIVRLARGLSQTSPGRRLMLFTGLLESPLDSDLLYSSFVCLRACLVSVRGNASAALCTPVKVERIDSGFPLHADLFVRRQLFIVFDDVAAGTGGESVFLSTRRLLTLVGMTEAMPARTKERVRRLLQRNLQNDSFDELYDLLHGNHDWVVPLNRLLKRDQQCVFLNRGEGYLLDDRHWLHGRLAARTAVRAARFRRLVY
jgi:hypothetical protein